jgi:hypothetical protein
MNSGKSAHLVVNSGKSAHLVVRRKILRRSAKTRDGTATILSQRHCPIHARVNSRYLIVLRPGKKSA